MSETEAEELDCLVDVGDGQIRGFLRLPSVAAPGNLRLIDDAPQLLEREQIDLTATLLEGSSGREASLLGCFMTHHSVSFPTAAAWPLEFHVDRVVVGTKDGNQPVPSAILAVQSALDFFQPSQVALEEAVKESVYAVERLKVNYGADCLLAVERVSTTASPYRADVVANLELQLIGRPRNLDDWAEDLLRVLSFLAFALDRPLVPDRLLFRDAGAEIELHSSWREPQAPAAQIPLLRLADVVDVAEAVFERWRALWSDASDLIGHVAEFQSRRDRMLLTDAVLWLARTLELYHAQVDRFESVARPKSEHKVIATAVIDGLPSAVADQHGQWIKQALIEANRKRLQAQIEDVLVDLGDGIVRACGIGDAEVFAKTLRATRNYLTHPDGDPPAGVPEGRDLYALRNQAWFVVRGCVLKELGFPPEHVAQALTESGYRYLLET